MRIGSSIVFQVMNSQFSGRRVHDVDGPARLRRPVGGRSASRSWTLLPVGPSHGTSRCDASHLSVRAGSGRQEPVSYTGPPTADPPGAHPPGSTNTPAARVGPGSRACQGRGMTTATPDLRDLLAAYYRHVAAEDLERPQQQEVREAALSHREAAAHPPARRRARAGVHARVRARHGRRGRHRRHAVPRRQPHRRDHPPGPGAAAGRAPAAAGAPRRQRGAARRRGLHRGLCRCTAEAVLPSRGSASRSTGVSDAAAGEQLAEHLRRVLGDVRAAVEDWPHMQAAARLRRGARGRRRRRRRAAGVARRPPLHLPGLGALRPGRRRRWSRPPGSGLGLLREGRASAVAAGPRGARARAAALPLVAHQVRAALHGAPAGLPRRRRRASCDGPDGRVVGEQRFLGLFASVAYTESVHRVPVVRRKVAQVLALSGYAEDSHSGRDLVTILETFPRDELFQTGVEDLLGIVTERAAAARAPPAAAVPAPRRLRPLHVGAGLPAARPLHDPGPAGHGARAAPRRSACRRSTTPRG